MITTNSLFVFGLIFTLFLIPLSQISFGETGSIPIESHDVTYVIENGIVDSMFLDPDFIELIITMTTNNDGTLEITIPRNLLDAKFESTDDIFFILVDGFETDYVEIETTSTYRTIVIPFFGGDSVVDIIGTDALNPFSEEPEIPAWIKNTAGWWADGSINDDAFVQAIQYLINEEIMIIPFTTQGVGTGNEIPAWIKNTAGWWADGSINDDAFVQAIQYLITNGIMQV